MKSNESDELMCSKNEFKTNCVVKRHHQYLDIRSVYQTISCSQSLISSKVVIMPTARRTSYNLAFKLKIVAEAEAVENNSEIARQYGISESMVCRWRKDQANLFNSEETEDDGMLHAKVSGARSKNTGMVYKAEKLR